MSGGEPKSFRTTARSALIWGTGVSISLQIVQVAISLILVRLLTPQIYGQFGLIQAIVVFTYVFSIQSFLEHALRQKTDNTLQYARHWSFGLILHGCLFVIVNGVAAGFLWIENLAPLAPYLAIGSIGILLNLPRILWSTVLQIELDWRRLRLLKSISVLLSGGVAIGLALSGFGVLALMAHMILVPVPFAADLFISRRGLIAWDFDFKAYASAMRFGITRSASEVLTRGRLLLESVFLSQGQGYAAYGIYGRAIGLGQLSTATFAGPAVTVLYPILSKLERGTQQAREASGLLLRASAWIALPPATLLILEPEAAVLIVFGSGWVEVAAFLPVAALICVGRVGLQALTVIVLTGIGPRIVLYAQLSLLAGYVAGLAPLLLSGEVLAYAKTIAVVYGGVCTGLIALLVGRGVLALSAVLRTLAACAASGSLAAVTWWQLVPAISGLDTVWQFVGAAGLCASTYLAVIRVIDAGALRDILYYVPQGRRLGMLLFLPPAKP